MELLRLLPISVRLLLSVPLVALSVRAVGETLSPQAPEAAPHVESTRPIASPDGKQLVVVDHLQPVDESGQRDEFSGLLRLRVSSAQATTGSARVRQIEAPRVRTIRAPQWLDERWAVVEYTISRVSRGMAYLDSASGRVVQLEIVASTGGNRSDAAQGTNPGSLSQFEVIDSMPDGRGTRLVSLTQGQASVFPLVIPAIPPVGEAGKTRADGSSLLDDVLTAMAAWEEAGKDLELPGATVDQASESVAPNGKHMAALACTENGPRLVIIPLDQTGAAETLHRIGVVALSPSIRLNCGTAESGEAEFGESRHATDWEGPTTVRIFRESFTAESDEPLRTNLIRATMEQGELRISTIAKPGPTSAVAPATAPQH